MPVCFEAVAFRISFSKELINSFSCPGLTANTSPDAALFVVFVGFAGQLSARVNAKI
jgi:hypothetical protein